MARILDVTPVEYHRLPQLSATIAKTLISRSPRHAREMRGKEPSWPLDRGNIIHRLVLGKGKDYAVLPFDDFRSKAAKEARDKARADGLIPVKEEDFAECVSCSTSIALELAERGVNFDGASELAVEWEEQTEHGPVACRAMLDHAWLGAGRILDLKITDNAAQSAVERTAENLGYAIQSAAYTRALIALRPELAGRVDFMFAFCEPESPFAMNLCRPDGMFREIGERRWLRAVTAWAECLKTDVWPAYGRDVNPISPPAWALAREPFAESDAA